VFFFLSLKHYPHRINHLLSPPIRPYTLSVTSVNQINQLIPFVVIRWLVQTSILQMSDDTPVPVVTTTDGDTSSSTSSSDKGSAAAAAADVPPNHTLYAQNLNEKIKLDGNHSAISSTPAHYHPSYHHYHHHSITIIITIAN
jgi:hypothetical protein